MLCHSRVCAAKSVVPANRSFAISTAIRFGRVLQCKALLNVILISPLFMLAHSGSSGNATERKKVAQLFSVSFA